MREPDTPRKGHPPEGQAESPAQSALASQPELPLQAELPSQKDPLLHLNHIARWLDSLITLPGTRISIGLDPLIGLIPGIGDIITALLSGYLVWFAVRLRVPRPILIKMLSNIAIDCTAGAVPVIGDLFDVSWRANKRNLALLRSHLETKEASTDPGKPWLRLLIASIIILLLGLAGAMISLTVMSLFTGT